MRRNAMPTGYIETYHRSLEPPEEFWAEAAEGRQSALIFRRMIPA
jgi:hypothetical protein